MYYDLNIPYTANQAELQRTLAFVAELGYDTVALNHTITGKVPGEISNEIPSLLPFTIPRNLRILRRCTLYLSDPSQNHRLQSLNLAYDVLALRPTNENSLLQACQNLECDLISLDLSVRFPFYFRHKTLGVAFQRGIKFEICYAPGMLSGDSGSSRKNLISNATQLIRATRGRGLIISSEAKRALGCRGPADVINMAVMWGLGQERGTEAVCREARSAVMQAEMRRRSFRGVIDIVYGGEKPARSVEEEKIAKADRGKGKRKADSMESQGLNVDTSSKPMSKREQKRQAKKARIENRDQKVKGAEKGSENEVEKEAEKETQTTVAAGDVG